MQELGQMKVICITESMNRLEPVQLPLLLQCRCRRFIVFVVNVAAFAVP